MSCSSELFDGTAAVPSLLAVDFKDMPDLWGEASRSRVCKTRCIYIYIIHGNLH